jgi:hypothetical protein
MPKILKGELRMMSDFMKRMDTIFYQQSFDAVSEFFFQFFFGNGDYRVDAEKKETGPVYFRGRGRR